METAHPHLNKRPRVKSVLPTECLACGDKPGYRSICKARPVEFRGETLEVVFEALECAKCSHTVLSKEQLERRVRETVAVYQRKHDMLTAREVVDRRKALGYATQQSFVDAAGYVTLPTLKRIEAGQHAQDPSTDRLLRLAFDELEEAKAKERMTLLLRMELPEPEGTGTVSATVDAPGVVDWPAFGGAVRTVGWVTLVASTVGETFLTERRCEATEIAMPC